MQQYDSKYFARRPLPGPWGGQTAKDQHFSDDGRVAYQIKWNHECSNMVLFDLILYVP